ncbi:MAG TPA: hypothetical protein VLC97_14095 [Rhodanobacteraceae bacterium]|nr:hypothetical protein [Rhodanobacteraceae bacterium]
MNPARSGTCESRVVQPVLRREQTLFRPNWNFDTRDRRGMIDHFVRFAAAFTSRRRNWCRIRIDACHAHPARRAFRNDSVPAACGKIDSYAVEQAQRRIAANLNQQEGSWSDGAREQIRDRS